MGLVSMVNFITSAVSTAVMGKLLDLEATKTKWNPMQNDSINLAYSNIFVLLAIILVGITIVYYIWFGSHKKYK